MDLGKLAKKLEGLQTISNICKILGISRRTAVNYVFLLRKGGFLETIYGKRKIRMYKIRPVVKEETGYPGLIETIDKYSKVKIIGKYEHRIYSHRMTVEEALVRAVKSRQFRIILSALGLFSKITNWSLLGNLAKKEMAGRKIGALYDVARDTFKVARMDKRTRTALLKSKIRDKYIIEGIRSKDFRQIEKIWNVYIPFNKADLEVYEE
jgi:hypothetical protein